MRAVRIGGEVLKSKDDFRLGFQALLGAVIREDGRKNQAIDPDRLMILERVYSAFNELFGDGTKVELKLHPAFRSGGVEARVSNVDFDKTSVLRLAEALSDCATFEIVPLTNGNVSITATVQQVYKKTE